MCTKTSSYVIFTSDPNAVFALTQLQSDVKKQMTDEANRLQRREELEDVFYNVLVAENFTRFRRGNFSFPLISSSFNGVHHKNLLSNNHTRLTKLIKLQYLKQQKTFKRSEATKINKQNVVTTFCYVWHQLLNFQEDIQKNEIQLNLMKPFNANNKI